jgi:hypothetical protein
MAVVRRNAGWFSLAGVVLCICVAVGWLVSRTPTEAAVAMQQSFEPLERAVAGQIEELRRDSGLDDDVLAAMDLSEQLLDRVLIAVRGWHETNRTQWLAKRSAVADQRALIRQLQSAINMGQDRTAELAAAREQLERLTADYDTFVARLRQTATANLSTQQQALAQRMYERRDVAMPFRALGLDATQDRAVKQGRSRYFQRLAVEREPRQRAAIQDEYTQELAAAIGTGNVQAISTLAGYLGPASKRVVEAVQRVLPVEPEG